MEVVYQLMIVESMPTPLVGGLTSRQAEALLTAQNNNSTKRHGVAPIRHDRLWRFAVCQPSTGTRQELRRRVPGTRPLDGYPALTWCCCSLSKPTSRTTRTGLARPTLIGSVVTARDGMRGTAAAVKCSPTYYRGGSRRFVTSSFGESGASRGAECGATGSMPSPSVAELEPRAREFPWILVGYGRSSQGRPETDRRRLPRHTSPSPHASTLTPIVTLAGEVKLSCSHRTPT